MKLLVVQDSLIRVLQRTDLYFNVRRIFMAKTAYEKALEKQQRENQKIAAQEARR